MAAPGPHAPRRPRILVIGFGPFPGAPVNPTETLVEALRQVPPRGTTPDNFRAEVLAVEYASLPARLAALGADFAPDIAIHFGLSGKARGFTLERLARNRIGAGRADNAGAMPDSARIVEGDDEFASSLPLDAIHAVLARTGLPVSWSDDAGDYVCNYLFYLSRGAVCPGFAPAMTGFVHMPPLREGEDAPGNAMTLGDLVAGVLAIVETCEGAWHGTGPPGTGAAAS